MSNSRSVYLRVFSLLLCFTPAVAAELKLVGGSAIAPVMAELIPRFEKSSGHHVTSELNAAIGAMTARVQQGEAADVIIVSRAQIEALEKHAPVRCSKAPRMLRVRHPETVNAPADHRAVNSFGRFRQIGR